MARVGLLILALSAMAYAPQGATAITTMPAVLTSDTTARNVECRSNGVCLVSQRGGVYRSANWGRSWTRVLDLPRDRTVNDIACGRFMCMLVGGLGTFPNTDGGWLQTSSDGGRTWDDARRHGEPIWAVDCSPLYCTALAHSASGIHPETTFLRYEVPGWVAYELGSVLDSPDASSEDISCPTDRTCVAVGRGFDPIVRLTFDVIEGASYSTECSSEFGLSCTFGTYKSVACIASTCIAGSWHFFSASERGSDLTPSTDGGRTWGRRWSSQSVILRGVDCASTRICLAVGSVGRILRSTNAGGKWAWVKSPTKAELDSISCAAARCLAVGSSGTIVYSGNSGATWISRPRMS